MKIVRIQGGLGNQMFQYAFLCKLKHIFPDERILMDLTNFNGYIWHNYELDYVFNIKTPKAHFCQLARTTVPFSANTKFGAKANRFLGRFMVRNNYVEPVEDYFSYNKNVFADKNLSYYNGYWFNEGYFLDIENEIRNVFEFRRPLNDYFKVVYGQINDTNSVGIHVRRGNYLLSDEYKGICEKIYYEKAIQYMIGVVDTPHFFVFSNDIPWCKRNLSAYMEKCTFVENGDPKDNYVDMQLMSNCKHNIIAHSSFSWWAAWLNKNQNKIVVAPYNWVNNDKVREKPQLNSWILVR